MIHVNRRTSTIGRPPVPGEATAPLHRLSVGRRRSAECGAPGKSDIGGSCDLKPAGLQRRGDQHMSRRAHRDPASKAPLARQAATGERTMSELPAGDCVHQTAIPPCRRSPPEGATGSLEGRGKAAVAAEVIQGTVTDQHTRIGEPAVTDYFLSHELKPRIGNCGVTRLNTAIPSCRQVHGAACWRSCGRRSIMCGSTTRR